MQYRRVIDALKGDATEAKIAERESIPVSVVRKIRAFALDQGDRQMAAVGVGFGRFLEETRRMHREIEEAIIDELQGAA